MNILLRGKYTKKKEISEKLGLAIYDTARTPF
jgi:hypothetical protein